MISEHQKELRPGLWVGLLGADPGGQSPGGRMAGELLHLSELSRIPPYVRNDNP